MKDIKKYLDEEREGSYSFYFEDLDGSYTYGYNHQVQKTSAGTMKLILAVLFLKKVEEGLFSLDELVTVREEDKRGGSGIIADFIERTYTIRELISAMLVIGDNTAANKLMKLLGVKKINASFTDLGLHHTVMSDEPGAPGNLTTAEDLASVIRALYRKEYLSDQHSQYILDLLRRRVKSKIALFLPDRERGQVASKTGNSEGIENEAALISNEFGNFIFTIMASELPNSVYGNMSLARAGTLLLDSIRKNWTDSPRQSDN